MSTNVKINITAETADLTVKAQLAKATITELTRDLNRAAKEQLAGDASPELTARALKLADALVKERAALAGIQREISSLATAKTAAVGAASNLAAATQAGAVSSGTMKFAMRDLSYQISDITTMFAMGAKPMQIFASQSGQVVGALSMMAGEAKGVLGVLGGPWGMIATSAAVALSPLIAKLFETGDAAEKAEIKIMGFANILAKARTKPMEALGDARDDYFKEIEKLNRMKAGNDPNVPLPGTRNISELQRFNKAIADQEVAVEAAKSAWDDMQTRVKTNAQLWDISAKAGRLRAGNIDAGDGASGGGGRRSRGAGSSTTAKDKADAEREAQQAANDQIEALAEDRYRTEAELSQIALRSRIDDINAEQRAGSISMAQSVRDRAAADDQMAQIDSKLQAQLFTARVNQLEADRRLYPQGSADYVRYTQQIEQLQAKHLNRQLIADRSAQAQAKATQKQADAAEMAELQRAEEKKRAIQERTVAPFAQSIARMLTLQRGFIGTVRDLWGSLTGIVEQAVARMVQSFLIGLLTQEVAQEASSRKAIIAKAKEAAANAWNAVVGIPIVGPVLAPIAAAASFAGVMAFASAEQGWDVPDSGGPGIDGRGGRPAVIHPREMVLPASIADSIRRGGFADAYPAQVAGGMDFAAIAMARPIAVNDGRASLSAAMAGTRFAGGDAVDAGGAMGAAGRRSGHGGGRPTHVTLNISAVDARGVRRLLIDNQHAVASAVDRAVRHGHRSEYRK